MWKVRELADKVTNVVMNYTEIESRVREATNDDPWGPTGTIKFELSQATFSYDQFPEVMGMLWKRIAENKRSPRRVYKSLLLLHHLLLHGSDRVVRAAQDRSYEIRALQDYHVVYEPGFNLDSIMGAEPTKDGELNVRVKAKELVELVQDEERLREERKKARKNRDKYVGISSDRMTTSKWDSTGDYGGSYDDDFSSSKRSRSPSPSWKSSGFKPYSDTESEFKKSSSSNSFNNNHSSFKSKPAPPSPGVEVSDDFDPRAEEKGNEFGDFASASSSVAAKVTIKPAPGSIPESNDFADFQSAFGDSTHKSEASASKPVEDLFGLMDLGGGSNSAAIPPASTQPASNASLLTDDLFSNHAPPSSFPAPLSNPNPAFSVPNFAPSPISVAPPAISPMGSGQFSPGFGAPMQSPSILTPVLEPAKPQGSQNNGNMNNNNNAKVSLKGTTWSDLDIKLDDLNLGRSNGRAQTAKTPMNQLKTNTPTNNFGGLL